MRALILLALSLLLVGAVLLARREDAAQWKRDVQDLRTQLAALQTRAAQLEQDLEAHRRRRAVEDRFDVRIVGAAQPFKIGKFSGEAVTERAFLPAVRVVADELDRLPRELIALARVKRIVLCENFKHGDRRWGGMPDYRTDTLYLSILYDPFVQRRAVHHELYHFIDWYDDRVLEPDPSWAALNPPGFGYTRRPTTARGDLGSTDLKEAPAGFLSEYSTQDAGEDKAEVFSALMTVPKLVADRTEKDMVFAAKVAMLKSRLYKACPAVGDAFWARVRAGGGATSAPTTSATSRVAP